MSNSLRMNLQGLFCVVLNECFRGFRKDGIHKIRHKNLDGRSIPRFRTLGAATFSDGLHGRVPAVASSPYASEHIGAHGLFMGQKASQLDKPDITSDAARLEREHLSPETFICWAHICPLIVTVL